MDRPIKLLLVEDSEEIRDLLRFVFEAQGFSVECASDGADALTLDLSSFDVIILDLQMPNMDGKEFLRISRHERALETPIIMFTSHERDGLEEELMKEGANSVLAKPARAERLIREVLSLVEKN